MERPKLLLADDSVTIRKVVELTFADEGVDVAAVADADSAMQRFVENQPDIVLVDASLAGTSGYRICEMIKADEATKHIPVLLLVGSFERFDDREAVRVGADGFMTKPFQSIRELVAKVRSLLDPPVNGGNPDASPIPVFGEGFVEVPPSSDGSVEDLHDGAGEEDDIDHLYRQSIEQEPAGAGENLEIDERFLGYAGMDDEMIETEYLPAGSDEPEELALNLGSGREYDPEKKFDWSLDALVETSNAGDDASKPAEADDDTTGIAAQPDESDFSLPPAFTAPDADISSMTTLEMSPAGSIDPAAPAHAEAAPPPPAPFEDDEILDLDANFPAPQSGFQSAIDPSGTPIERTDSVEDDFDPSIHETIPYAYGEQPPIQEDVSATDDRYSPELIEKIAQRVIERLSDSVVREIARIEVPRIAEKLIREALDEGK